MYAESSEDGGQYAQIPGPSSEKSSHLIYWRCVLVFFTLAKKQISGRDDVRLCLFTNVARLPVVDGVDLGPYLEKLEVDIIQIDFRWRPRFPQRAWYNQFFVFDILDYFEVHAHDQDHFIVADSDCLAVASLEPMFATLVEDGYLTIDVATEPDENINGITRRHAATLYGVLGGFKQPLVAPYYGGEFFGISGRYLGSFLALSRDAFAINNRRAESGMAYLTEEAHVLSFVFLQLGVTAANADRYVRRIWTTWKSNNTRLSDLDLPVWHVPAEKILGIHKLSRQIAGAYRKSKSDLNFSKAVLSRALGVGRKRPSKYIKTFFFAVIRRLRQKLSLKV